MSSVFAAYSSGYKTPKNRLISGIVYVQRMTLEQQLEGVLFYKAAPIKKTVLAKLFAVSEDELTAAFTSLAARLEAGATRLLLTDTEAELVTAPELDALIESQRKDELKRDIGKAGAETLAIILYRGPISRSEIDYIRGVNSAFILRNLQVRGLIERDSSSRSVSFQGTSALLAHLGLTDKTSLPQYTEIMSALDAYEADLETESP